MDEVHLHRNMHCGVYNLCLAVAVRRKWPSFSCRPCSLWGRRADELHDSQPATVLALPVAGRR